MTRFAVDGRLLAYSPAGISQYTRQLVTHMSPLIAGTEQLSLLTSARRPSPPLGIPGLRNAPVLTPPHHRLEQLGLSVELLRHRPHVLHSPDFIPPFRGPWRRVITVHDLAFLLYPHTVTDASHAYYGQIRKAVRIADAIIAVSHHTAHDITRVLGVDPGRVRTIPNGVDPALAPVEDPSVLGRWRAARGIDRPYLLFTGTFEPRKNLPLLIEAFASIREHADMLLVLMGARGWKYEPTFQRIHELGLGEHIRILEGVPRHDYATAYSGASAAITPSLYEGFGLTVLEAMACGAPVIASDAAALPEVVGDAGLLFESGNARALADAIERIISEPALVTILRDKGLARARQFPWSRSAADTLEVYRQVAA